MSLQEGLKASVTRTVTGDDTAIALGSGDVPVLGTPRVVAWCEAATVEVVASELEAGMTTVGTTVRLDHLAPTGVGAEVVASAELETIDNRRLTFAVSAHDAGELIASGTITRIIVDIDRFLAPLARS